MKKILIVDDEENIRKLYTEELLRRGDLDVEKAEESLDWRIPPGSPRE